MLINVIQFEIRNFANGSFEQFTVENTADNFELITSHRCTRGIQFETVFDFQFERIEKTPQFMELARSVADSFNKNGEMMELCEIDEMVGAY
jgi:hypothetical protein